MAVIPSAQRVLPSAWAASGDKTEIPSSAQASGRASYAEGFSPKTSLPETSGGVPPARSDVNGVLNELSNNIIWFQHGGQCTWDSTMNFTPPCIVLGSDNRYYSCESSSGPDVTGVGAKNPTETGNTGYWIRIKAGTSDNTETANTLTTARRIAVNLSSNSPSSFDGSSDITTGASGVLPISRGGTGATTADAAKSALGISDAPNIHVLGAPSANIDTQLSVSVPITITMSKPTAMISGATIKTYTITAGTNTPVTVNASNDIATYTFTPTGTVGTTYNVTVTCIDNLNNSSLAASYAPTLVAAYVTTPTITSPTSNANVNGTITIVSSAFSVTNGSDTHLASDWKITSDAAGNTIVASALNSTDRLSYTFANGTIETKGTYYLWVRHKGTSLGWSNWCEGIAISYSPTRHGEILYNGSTPIAVIIGSKSSNGADPWTIRGNKVWIAVGLASVRGVNKSWNDSTSDSNWDDISGLNNVSGTDATTITSLTESSLDSTFTYATAYQNSSVQTAAIRTAKPNHQAAQYARSITCSTGAMDLPSIDVLSRIFQCKDIIDNLDPTAAANTTKKLSNWGFGSSNGSYVWSSSEYDSSYAWAVNSNGSAYYSYTKYAAFGVVPVAELPA